MKIVTAWLSAVIPAAALADGLVGATVPPYPVGFGNEQGGACIAQALGIARECDFSVGILEDASSVPTTLFGGRLAGRDDKGRARWTVTDAVPYPALPEGYFLAIATCEADGKKDETIVAVVRAVEEEEWLADVLWARRFDLDAQKFVDQPSEGVRCLNEGWGL
jgi:hypothetical protein